MLFGGSSFFNRYFLTQLFIICADDSTRREFHVHPNLGGAPTVSPLTSSIHIVSSPVHAHLLFENREQTRLCPSQSCSLARLFQTALTQFNSSYPVLVFCRIQTECLAVYLVRPVLKQLLSQLNGPRLYIDCVSVHSLNSLPCITQRILTAQRERHGDKVCVCVVCV